MRWLHWKPSDEAGPDDGIVVRAFGSEIADLGVDFAAASDTVLTDVLALCVAGDDTERAAGWTVKKRRQALIAVAVCTDGTARSVAARCANPDCAAAIELDVDLRAFRTDWRPETIALDLGSGRRATLRAPRPADLAGWASRGGGDSAEAARDLLVEHIGPLPGDWAERAAEALEADDPLADPFLNTACPACGMAVAVPFVLEKFLLAEMERRAVLLVDEIHLIASAYHWREADILALPEGRRRRYLALLAKAWAA